MSAQFPVVIQIVRLDVLLHAEVRRGRKVRINQAIYI